VRPPGTLLVWFVTLVFMAVVITVVLPIFSGPPAEKPRSAVAKQDKREEKPLTVELLHPTEEWCRRAGDPGCCPTVSG